MPNISLRREEIPFWLGGSGKLSVDVARLNPNAPIPPGTGELLNVNFGAAGDEPFALGHPGTVKIGVRAGARASLLPLSPENVSANAALAKKLGISGFFEGGANGDKLLLVLDLSGTGGGSAGASLRYSVLKATATLDCGVDAALMYTRAMPREQALTPMLANYFRGMRLPAMVDRAPEPGEVISLQFGGYLKLGVQVTAGYELKGTKGFRLGELDLSEHYRLSVVGSVGFNAQVAGSFAVDVRGSAEHPGWARVAVRRHRAQEYKIAGDVAVDANARLDRLPATSDEFLGAVLGVNAKNFLNVLERVRQLSDLEAIKKELDGLSRRFLSEWIGRGFEALSETEFKTVLEHVNRVVDRYQNLENYAITLIDRYVDRLDVLLAQLDRIKELASWDDLAKHLDGPLAATIGQLTDGDPLGWIADRAIDALKARAETLIRTIQERAQEEVIEVIRLAKAQFGLDPLFASLAQVDTIEELQQLANTKAGDFASRLLGRAVDSMSTRELKDGLKRLRSALDAQKTFRDRLYGKLREAANQSFKASLHAEYSRASEEDALIDVLLNLETEQGRALMHSAGHGDFTAILADPNPAFVRVLSGVLTHRATRRKSFRVNIIGWHHNFNYEGFDRVLTATEQQIVTEADGSLTVYTTVELNTERERRRQGETVHAQFLLRALAESASASFNPRTREYLLDTLTSLTARYRLHFTDAETSGAELRDYLSFAKAVGLDAAGATAEALLPLLPRVGADNYGRVNAEYSVSYSRAALDAVLSVAPSEAAVRNTMRQIVFGNYISHPLYEEVAWAYGSQMVYEMSRNLGPTFTNTSARQIDNVDVCIPGLKAPKRISLNAFQLRIVSTLFNIEDAMVRAIGDLYALVTSGEKVSPRELERRLHRFGDVMNQFDNFDQVVDDGSTVNTMFAVFDRLVALAAPARKLRAASLKLESEVDGRGVAKLFLTEEAAAAVAA